VVLHSPRRHLVRQVAVTWLAAGQGNCWLLPWAKEPYPLAGTLEKKQTGQVLEHGLAVQQPVLLTRINSVQPVMRALHSRNNDGMKQRLRLSFVPASFLFLTLGRFEGDFGNCCDYMAVVLSFQSFVPSAPRFFPSRCCQTS
jgi:hypothetical protein